MNKTLAFVLMLFLMFPIFPAQAEDSEMTPRCTFAEGLRLSAGACLDIEERRAGKLVTLEQAKMLKGSQLRRFCPNLIALEKRSGGVRKRRLELDAGSPLYDVSNCCGRFELSALSVTRFVLLGYGRDCFGGTDRWAIEETYQFAAGKRPKLVQRRDMSDDPRFNPEVAQ